MSDFVSLYTAFSGLQAAQAGLDTTSHNIANAATIGYTRQRVQQASRVPYYQRFGTIGQGVDVVDITRARVTALDLQVRNSASAQGRLDILADLLSTSEAMMGEPDAGITSSLSGLWSALEELVLDPPDPAARHNVITALDSVATSIRGVADKWTQQAGTTTESFASYVSQTNDLLRQVADLNQKILTAQSLPGTPNDLLDQRDLVLDELANIAGTTATVVDNGSVRVSLDGLNLVSDTMVSPLSFNAATGVITHSSGATVTPGGELAGFDTFLHTELPSIQSRLDIFAQELADALNAQHALGFTTAGTAGGDLLSYTPGLAAKTIAVAVSDQSQIAAAGSGPPVAAYDGANAEALADLRTMPSAGGGTISLEDAIRALVSYVGETTSAAAAGVRSQAALTAAAESGRMQAHGVSIDEEMVNIVTYQRAYEAAARVMTAVDESLDTLINHTGIVGR
jgi:flagellar hook-associated protein 1 FlgK